MFDPDFWKYLDNRLTIYKQLLHKVAKKDWSFSKNQYKSERQLYEDKLNEFIKISIIYDNFYFNRKL